MITRVDLVDIELNSGSLHRSFAAKSIGAGDSKANRFGVRLFRNGEPVSAESCTVTGLFIAPNGTRYVISETSFSGSTGTEENTAWVQLPSVCYTVTGQFTLAIKLTGGSVEGTMRIVDGTVDETGEEGAVVPSSTIPATADIIAAYEEAVEVIAGSVRFDAEQTLSEIEKATARDNIGAAEDQEIKDIINDSVLANSKNIDPDELENILAAVSVPVIMGVTSQDWNDMPDGISAGTFINYVYDTVNYFATQVIISYPDRRMFSRVVKYNIASVLYPWREYTLIDTLNSTLVPYSRRFAPDAAENDYLIGKVKDNGIFAAVSSDGWTDLPKPSFSGVISNQVYYAQNYAVQIAYNFETAKDYVWMRYVNVQTGAAIGADWQRIDGFDSAHIGTLDPTDYDGELAKVAEPIKTGFASSANWTDFPEGEGAGAFIPVKYGEGVNGATIQLFVSYPSLATYMRITQGKEAKTSWKVVGNSGIASGIVYYAIGDSITAGSYSNDQGQGIVAKDVEWAYPNRIGAAYGCVVHNLGIPGAAITEFATQVALVGSDATIVTITGGANDYYGRDIPLGTHESPVDYTSVCGAIKSAIEAVANTAPNARIVLISPFIIKYGSISTKWSMNHAGRAGFTYAQLSDAMKDIAEDYNIEFIDGTREGPTNILNIGDVQKDNIHPTKVFYKTIANWIGSKLF